MSEASDDVGRIAAFSDHYQEEYIEGSPQILDSEKDPFQVHLLFRKVFASARSDRLSRQYREAAETVLRDYKREIEGRWTGDTNAFSKDEFLTELADAGIGNQHDRRMVVETIKYLGELDDFDHRIMEYTRASIQEGHIKTVFDELNSIHNVGPKKATLFLRDVVSGSNLEEYVNGDDYRYVFPVDTRVFQVAEELDLVSTDSPRWETNSTEIVEACGDSVSPIEFNQGAWYIGKNAFEIVIDQLEQIEPSNG